ncbi:MAG: DNA polymerase II large subunit [Nanoarchaeota archaeon]
MEDKATQKYFQDIDKKVKLAYEAAAKAKKQGYDPEDHVAIPLAKNMAERVVGLISVIAPQILDKGIPTRITELEKQYGAQDWRVALTIAKEVTDEKFCTFENKLEAMEIGMRVGFAYVTMGTVASPLEGFVKFKSKKRKDGGDYISVYYSGPIRSAGGTGASVSVLIADYLRKKANYAVYDPTEAEIQRAVTEVADYHERITNLQYYPSTSELTFLMKNLPLQIDGDPSEDIEVSNYKDIDRIETNRIRNGPSLVLCECLSQKAPKLWAQISRWGKDFDLGHWGFLQEFINIQNQSKSKSVLQQQKSKISPNFTYIKDLVAGRPVLAHPLAIGGFRLRYGRSRVSGFSAASIHPATASILNEYIATGTQLKVERPGKAASITFCDTIEGPIVKLDNGTVQRIPDVPSAKKINHRIKEILFLGDILFNYGDFYNRNHTLIPSGYCEEYWVQELERETVALFGSIDLDKLSELTGTDKEKLVSVLKYPLTYRLDAKTALSLSQKIKVPLYPGHSYFWTAITRDEFSELMVWLIKAKIVNEPQTKIILPFEKKPKRYLERIGVPHNVVNNEFVVIDKDDAVAFSASVSLDNISKTTKIISENMSMDTLGLVNLLSGILIKDKSGVFIGARMGRPEKAKMRKLAGSPHVLFPVGEEGGKLRCFQSAMEAGKIQADFSLYRCLRCNTDTVFKVCETCQKRTQKMYHCTVCGLIQDKNCKIHGPAKSFLKKEIPIPKYFEQFLKQINLKTYPDLIKGVRGTSNKDHIPEHLIKGIIRSKHNLYVNKDGTIRYDMTQLPITHFKPVEVGTPIEKLVGLGYTIDIFGEPLQKEDQIVELKPQDIILPSCDESPDEGADKVLFRVTKAIDELLTKLYNLKPFYNLKSEKDLVGQLVLALAPHTSAGIVGRIIGFSKTQGFFAHPMLHAATRRDCDGDEASVVLIMDALLNFSRQFLPNTRGATQDAPLVLTSKLIPSEVDDMVFDMEVVYKYPLEFYESLKDYKQPREVKIEQLSDRLNTVKQYVGFGFTHDTSNINVGVRCSAYKTLPSMREKLLGQMDLAEKIRAVDEIDVARLVIEKHFLPDIKGNLRKFSMQQFRCVNCNVKYRRPPLIGKCTKCGGRIIFTISEGSIIKYLEPSIALAEKYNLPSYLKQTLELTKRSVEGVFGKEKEKQIALAQWF